MVHGRESWWTNDHQHSSLHHHERDRLRDEHSTRHHQWLPDELVGEPFGLSGDTQRALTSRGHTLAKLRYLGDAEGIMIEEKTGVRLGATDPRRSDGQAVGY